MTLRCDICGRFIGWREITRRQVCHAMVTPDSAYTAETWETHHKKCDRKQP